MVTEILRKASELMIKSYRWYGVMMVMSGIQIIISAAQTIRNDCVLIDAENKKIKGLIEQAVPLSYVLLQIIVDYADLATLCYYPFPLHDELDYSYVNYESENESAFLGILHYHDGCLRKNELIVSKQSECSSHHCCGFSTGKNDVIMRMYGNGLSGYITEKWGWNDHRISKGFGEGGAGKFLKNYGIDLQVVSFFTYILENCRIQLVDASLPVYKDALKKSTVLYREDVTWCKMGREMDKIWATFSKVCPKDLNHQGHQIMEKYIKAYTTSNIARVLKGIGANAPMQPLLYRNKTSYTGKKRKGIPCE